MSGGKGGEQTSKIEIDPRIEDQAVENMKLANMVGRLPNMRNFGGTVAAFTPQQEAAMQSANSAAASMGLPSVSYGGPNTGMGIPQAQNFGGFQGYSTQGVYQDAISRVPKGLLDLHRSLTYNPVTGAAPRAYGQGGALDPSSEFQAGASPVPAARAPVTTQPASATQQSPYNDYLTAKRAGAVEDYADWRNMQRRYNR